MKLDVGKLDSALDGLQDAALSPERWPSVLDKIAEAACATGALFLPTKGSAPGYPVTESLMKPLEAFFCEGWHVRDFRYRGLPQLRRKGSVLEQDFATQDDFKNEEYYRFLAHFGLRYSAIFGFASGGDEVLFVLHRTISGGAIAKEEELILRRMRERLSLSAFTMQTVTESRTSGLAEAFDLSRTPCLFFDRHGRVVQMNGAAQSLMGADLQVVAGDIRTRRPEEAVALRRRVKSAIDSRLLFESNSDAPLLITQAGKRPLVVRIQRLKGNICDLFSHAVAMAVIENLEVAPVPTAAVLKTVFGLTPAEATIAGCLAKGDGPREIAEKLAITYETARTHVNRILQKTETGRQSELTALLARLRLS